MQSSSSPPRRTRTRSNSIRGENPLETPLTAEEHELSRLGADINRADARSRRQSVSQAAFRQTDDSVASAESREEERLRRQRRANLVTSGGYTGTTLPGSSRSDQIASDTEASLFAPGGDPIDRSKTPTQADYLRQVATDLLPGNPALRVSPHSNERTHHPFGNPLPPAAGGSSSGSERDPSSYQLPQSFRPPIIGPRPPIPVVERSKNTFVQPGTQSAGESSGSTSSRPADRSEEFPVRGVTNTKTNPTRRKTQNPTTADLPTAQTATVSIWDPRPEETSSDSEAFPAFEEDSGFQSSSVEAKDPDAEELSPIGKLIAQNRPRKTSFSSNGSVVTVIRWTGPKQNTSQSTVSEERGSAAQTEKAPKVPPHLTNPSVFSVQLPEEHFRLLESLRIGTPEPRSGAESRNDHYDTFSSSTHNSSQRLKPADSELCEEYLHPGTEDSATSKQQAKPRLENKYYSKDTSSGHAPSIPLSDIERQQLRAELRKHIDSARRNFTKANKTLSRSDSFSDLSPKVQEILIAGASLKIANMSFQNYADQPSGGSGVNPRQAPPSPSQGAPHTNGMNGGMVGGMIGYPTPAGHQSDLNYLMTLVEDLSGVLAHNQRLTNGVVEKMGRVRERAQNLNLSNDELLQIAASELNDGSHNLERENTELRAALEKSDYDKKENFKLACHGANILADITEKMHAFKEQHEADTLAWHKNYRNQLAEEREENLRLRNEINEKIASAARANGHLRDMRRYVADHDELNELKIKNTQLRQQARWWKRMAFPLIPDDDSEWSDDDDLVDPEEKKRLAALLEKKVKDQDDAEGGGADASAA